MKLQRFRPGKIVKLIILCLIVGLAMSALGVATADFWRAVWSLAQKVYAWMESIFGGAADYILIGAGVVIPIYLARVIYRRVRR